MVAPSLYYAIRMWWAVPLVGAMLVLMFAMGAAAGAEDRYPEDPRVVDEFTTDMADISLEQSRDEAFEKYQPTGVRRLLGNMAVTVYGPLIGALKWAAIEGYWFGLANPSVGDWIIEAANLFALIVVAGYVYATYRGLKKAGKWIW